MTATWTRARRVASSTPAERNRYVDLLRALSIVVVVVGHWLMAAPELEPNGDLVAGHVLADLPWTQWLTWAFQVMPIFFMVGGYANAASWRSARSRGESYGTWIHGRLHRLVLPVLPLVAVWTALAAVLLAVDFDPALVRIGSQTALVPVWFLAVYIAVAALAPLTLAAWERWGWISFGFGVVAAVLTDWISISLDNDWIGWLNYLFIWGSVHQLGYAWRDDRLVGFRRTLTWGVVGLGSLLILVSVFDYPVSMVGVPGADVNNTLPPRLPLLALGVFQTGVLLAAERPARRILDRETLWTGTVLVNSMIMTIYLWHLTAMVALLGILLALGGFGLRLNAGSGEWWLTRPIWLAVVALLLIPFITAFLRFERPKSKPAPPSPWRGIVSVISVCAGLALLAYWGIGDENGLNWIGIGLTSGGAAIGSVVALERR